MPLSPQKNERNTGACEEYKTIRNSHHPHNRLIVGVDYLRQRHQHILQWMNPFLSHEY